VPSARNHAHLMRVLPRSTSRIRLSFTTSRSDARKPLPP
jgi:hypothetical protein